VPAKEPAPRRWELEGKATPRARREVEDASSPAFFSFCDADIIIIIPNSLKPELTQRCLHRYKKRKRDWNRRGIEDRGN
jgi:hypothetical protein